jgi:lipopolysaccharide transport system permease protein
MSVLHPSPIHGLGRSRFREALGDWWRGTSRWDTWLTLAWFDVVLRYRRSYLGPLWITLSMAAMIAIIGPLYAMLFGISMRSYLPSVTLGFILWSCLAGCITEGCNSMVAAAGHLRQGAIPPSLIAWRVVTRNLIHLAHHMLLFVAVAFAMQIAPGPTTLLAIPGFLLAALTLHAWTLSAGIACARFRDIVQVVPPVVQLAFFLTPVLWDVEQLPERARFVALNPFAVLIDLMRSPLLGEVPAASAWLAGLAWLAGSATLAAALSVAQQRRLVYWL